MTCRISANDRLPPVWPAVSALEPPPSPSSAMSDAVCFRVTTLPIGVVNSLAHAPAAAPTASSSQAGRRLLFPWDLFVRNQLYYVTFVSAIKVPIQESHLNIVSSIHCAQSCMK